MPIRSVVLLLLLSCVLSAVERPNILWLVSEDNSPYLSCYGDPIARTPNLDGLAKQGVRYIQARAAAPVCAPSLTDGNAAIRVAAAKAVLLRHSDPAAITVINDVLVSKAMWPIRLAAANAVSRLKDRTPFIEALKQCDKSDEYLGRMVSWLLGQ
jgi:hypothetical protein